MVNIQKIYPTAPFNIEDQAIATIKKGRLNEFMNEKKKLEDLLTHYIKIKKRWTKADSVLKITGITIGALAALTGTIIASIPTVGIAAGIVATSLTATIVSGTIGGFSALELFLTESLSIGLTSKKKKQYREICNKLELGINKLYLYQVKALSDNVLTVEEIEESIKIVQDIKDEISLIKENMIITTLY